MSGIKSLFQRFRKALGLQQPIELDQRLGQMERVFHAPSLTPELLGAIKRISPQYDFTATEKDRLIWEADQNGACWGEYEALAPIFESIPKPNKILEIGPGMGRSLIFFSKKLGWQDAEIHAYEGDGTSTKYGKLGPRSEDSYCGNIEMLSYLLDFNGLHNVTIFNATDTKLIDLPGPYDLLYAFYGIGFHWSLEHFLDDLLSLMHDQSVALFIVPNEFTPFPGLQQCSYKMIDFKTVWPKKRWLKMLVLNKTVLPKEKGLEVMEGEFRK